MEIPTEPIGSIPRPRALIDAIAEYGSGMDPRLDAAYDDAVRDTITRLEGTGSPMITDGEQRKYHNFWTYGVEGSPNTARDGFEIPFKNGHVRRMPRLVSGPFRYQRYADRYLEGALRYAKVPLKQAVISPSALSLLYPEGALEGYPRDEFIADLIDEHVKEVRRCFAQGAAKVQIDFTEGRLAMKIDPTGALLSAFVDLNNIALARFTPTERARLGVHTCPGGDRDSTHSADVDYADLLPSLFELNVTDFYVALAGEPDRVGVLEMIRERLKPEQRVFVGVVAPIDPRIETPEEVCERVLEAARYIPIAQLGTTDDCGYAPFCDDVSTTRDKAFAKIRARVLGTKLAEDKLGDAVMAKEENEQKRMRAAALKNAESILVARRRAERDLVSAKESLERTTEELEQQREWFAVTLSSIGDAVITTDTSGTITFLNPVAESMTGWSLADAKGAALERVFRIINEDTREPIENPLQKVLESGKAIGLANHTALVGKDGRVIAIEDSAAPIRNASGDISGAVLVFHDVTDRRKAERALRASEERLHATFSQAAVGIAIANLENRFVEANQKFCDILGFTLEELRHRTFMELTHPDDVEETRREMARLRAGQVGDYVVEKRYVRKDGRIVWSRTTVTQLREPTGESERFIGVIEDITDRKRAELVLREQARVLEILNKTGTSIAAQLDLQALVQEVTDAATQLTGAKFGAFFYNVTNEHGESFLLFSLSGAPREAFEKFGLPRNTPVFDPTFRGEGVVRSDDITKDPRYGTMSPHHGMPKGHLPVRSYLAAPVTSRSGEVIGGLFFGHPEPGVFTEHTERLLVGVAAQAAIGIDNARLYEAAQRELARRERAEAALRETDRRKDEFLATLAHELRNPLAPIRQAAQISKASTATDAQKRWSHDVISRQVDHMALLLDDLLDVSRITRGTLELRTEMTELSAVIDAAVETARPVIDAKRHALTIDVPRTPVHFSADPLRLAQVLSNLLTNAAKYTDPNGKIRLSATATGDAVTIAVTDTGIGIPVDALPQVFAMFSQVKSGQDRSEGGLGIGLALARGLVELHGGTIEARSSGLGHGSEFVVRLPRRALGADPGGVADEAVPRPATRRRVLIADDNRDAAESLAMLLKMEGHDVTVAHDGAEALEAFKTVRPEVALLDIGMPKMNGYEVARRIREDSLGRAVTLVAVTGWGQDNDKARALAVGFNYHFTKPVEPERLCALLRSEHLGA